MAEGKKACDAATHGVWHVTCGALRPRALSSAHRPIAAAIISPVLWKTVFWLFLLGHGVGEGALVSHREVGKDIDFHLVVILELRTGESNTSSIKGE